MENNDGGDKRKDDSSAFLWSLTTLKARGHHAPFLVDILYPFTQRSIVSTEEESLQDLEHKETLMIINESRL